MYRLLFVQYQYSVCEKNKIKAAGLLSRVIQHEMDHLNGVLFVDRVKNNLALTEQLKKKGFALSAVKPIE